MSHVGSIRVSCASWSDMETIVSRSRRCCGKRLLSVAREGGSQLHSNNNNPQTSAAKNEATPIKRTRNTFCQLGAGKDGVDALSFILRNFTCPCFRLLDDPAGGLTGCAGSAREARRKWAQAPADTRAAETRQPLSHLMAPLAAELPR